MYQTYLQTPIGSLRIVSDGSEITEISVCDTAGEDNPDALTQQAAAELKEYFAGMRTAFDLPLAPQGTAFQKSVWTALRQISFGKTVTYGDLAKQIGKPTAARAVGSAIGKNPILILQPCHRVLATNGLGGFSAGLDRKKHLLLLEQKR